MSRKRIPKGRVQRKVMLDRKALSWALNAMRDDRYKVEQASPGNAKLWAADYEAADKHLRELIAMRAQADSLREAADS